MGSYIKIDRKILEWEWWADINTQRLFFYMLLKANWKDGNFRGVVIPRGSFASSTAKLSEETNMTVDEVRTALKHLKSTNEITSKSHGKFSVFTIKNYCAYQDVPEQMPKQTPNCSQTVPEQTPSKSRSVPILFPTIEELKELKELEELEEGEEGNLTVSNETVCRTDVRRIIDAWNALHKFGIAQVTRISGDSKRYKSLISRIKQYGTGKVLDAIEKITESDFLQGKNKSGWSITFDWFVLPSNFPKVLEGNYDNRTQTVDCGFKDSSKESQFGKLMEQIRRDEENANRGC